MTNQTPCCSSMHGSLLRVRRILVPAWLRRAHMEKNECVSPVFRCEAAEKHPSTTSTSYKTAAGIVGIRAWSMYLHRRPPFSCLSPLLQLFPAPTESAPPHSTIRPHHHITAPATPIRYVAVRRRGRRVGLRGGQGARPSETLG